MTTNDKLQGTIELYQHLTAQVTDQLEAAKADLDPQVPGNINLVKVKMRVDVVVAMLRSGAQSIPDPGMDRFLASEAEIDERVQMQRHESNTEWMNEIPF